MYDGSYDGGNIDDNDGEMTIIKIKMTTTNMIAGNMSKIMVTMFVVMVMQNKLLRISHCMNTTIS